MVAQWPVANSLNTSVESVPLTLQLAPAVPMTGEQFFEFCRLNKNWRFERTAQGELVIMSPTGSETGARNFDLAGQLWAWAKQDGTGKGFDSSSGFTLPNGAVRSPDLAWILLSRWEAIPASERKRFAPICPDFVLELRSESDALEPLQAKMVEYLENGARLGLLIDRKQRQVLAYRPGQAAEVLDNPTSVSGETVLPGFRLVMENIW